METLLKNLENVHSECLKTLVEKSRILPNNVELPPVQIWIGGHQLELSLIEKSELEIERKKVIIKAYEEAKNDLRKMLESRGINPVAIVPINILNETFHSCGLVRFENLSEDAGTIVEIGEIDAYLAKSFGAHPFFHMHPDKERRNGMDWIGQWPGYSEKNAFDKLSCALSECKCFYRYPHNHDFSLAEKFVENNYLLNTDMENISDAITSNIAVIYGIAPVAIFDAINNKNKNEDYKKSFAQISSFEERVKNICDKNFLVNLLYRSGTDFPDYRKETEKNGFIRRMVVNAPARVIFPKVPDEIAELIKRISSNLPEWKLFTAAEPLAFDLELYPTGMINQQCFQSYFPLIKPIKIMDYVRVRISEWTKMRTQIFSRFNAFKSSVEIDEYVRIKIEESKLNRDPIFYYPAKWEYKGMRYEFGVVFGSFGMLEREKEALEYLKKVSAESFLGVRAN